MKLQNHLLKTPERLLTAKFEEWDLNLKYQVKIQIFGLDFVPEVRHLQIEIQN